MAQAKGDMYKEVPLGYPYHQLSSRALALMEIQSNGISGFEKLGLGRN